MQQEPGWNSFGRANAAQKWRKQSAAMGRQMTEMLVAEARVERGMRVLDVACGTGEPAISIAVLLQGSGAVAAIDLVPAPLKLGQARAAERGLPNITFEQADVHQLPFRAGAFDRLTCRLALMFFADCARALREIHRVLKPRGRASAVVWGPFQQPYFQTTLAVILRLIPGIGPDPQKSPLFKFAQPGTLEAAFREAGFSSASAELRDLEWPWRGTPAEVWAYFQEVTVPFRPLLQAIPPERRAEVDAAVIDAISRYYDGQQVNFTAQAVFASAEK